MTEPIRITGHQFVESTRDGDRRHLVTKVRVEVGERVRYEVEGVGTGRRAAIETASPHVRKFLRDADEASRLTSEATIQPYSKADQVGPRKTSRRDPSELVPCVVCDGQGWGDCPLCDGAGEITIRAARAYRE